MPRINQISQRGTFSEREVSNQHLGDFKSTGSLGKRFTDKIGCGVVWKKAELITLANICSEIANLRFPRDYKRNRELVYKWLSDNYLAIEPLMNVIRIG
jgi:hypothetical protein